MSIFKTGKLVALVLCLALAGCATSRSEIKLASPVAAPAASGASGGRAIVIREVTDERVFEEKPAQASTPSLGFGGAAAASADVKARAIGRKRGGYGKAMGDVLLENGQTVVGVVRENLAAALQQAGYEVVADAGAAGSPLVVDVHIKRFWAWFQPGFWAITLNTNIATDLQFSGGGAPITIAVDAIDKRQMATDGAWMEIIAKALDQYRVAVAANASSFPK